VDGAKRSGFRPPLTTVLPVVGIMFVVALILPSELTVALIVLVPFCFLVLRLRQLLILAEDHLEVTVLRTRRIPWEKVQGFEAGSRLRGGTMILTDAGVVHSVAPCSRWGGPPAEADLATLHRMLTSRVGKA
jgi:hypothetical protein